MLENEIARQLGDGIISGGVRLALRAAQVNGIEVSLTAAKKFGQLAGHEPAAAVVSDVSPEASAASGPPDASIGLQITHLADQVFDSPAEQINTQEAFN